MSLGGSFAARAPAYARLDSLTSCEYQRSCDAAVGCRRLRRVTPSEVVRHARRLVPACRGTPREPFGNEL
eukprot:scaffold70861_cov32-Tisochrysis_lutea.AAC.3